MFVFATHYGEHDISWIPDFAGENYVIYDRSDCGLKNRVSRENVGDADYDKLTWLVDTYFELPEVFLWTKSNLFKFITPEEFDGLKETTEFTPLLTQHHKTYEPICRYNGSIYEEINNSWYLSSVPSRYFKDYGEFAASFGLPNPLYLRFAPGGNYILTRDRIHRYGVDFYDRLRSILPYCQRPGEAHFLERTYYTLWS